MSDWKQRGAKTSRDVGKLQKVVQMKCASFSFMFF